MSSPIGWRCADRRTALLFAVSVAAVLPLASSQQMNPTNYNNRPSQWISPLRSLTLRDTTSRVVGGDLVEVEGGATTPIGGKIVTDAEGNAVQLDEDGFLIVDGPDAGVPAQKKGGRSPDDEARTFRRTPAVEVVEETRSGAARRARGLQFVGIVRDEAADPGAAFSLDALEWHVRSAAAAPPLPPAPADTDGADPAALTAVERAHRSFRRRWTARVVCPDMPSVLHDMARTGRAEVRAEYVNVGVVGDAADDGAGIVVEGSKIYDAIERRRTSKIAVAEKAVREKKERAVKAREKTVPRKKGGGGDGELITGADFAAMMGQAAPEEREVAAAVVPDGGSTAKKTASVDGRYRPTKVSVERRVVVRKRLGPWRLNPRALLRSRDANPSSFSGRDQHLPPGLYTDGRHIFVPHYDYRRGAASMRRVPDEDGASAPEMDAAPAPQTFLRWLEEVGPDRATKALERVQRKGPDIVQETLTTDPSLPQIKSESYAGPRGVREALLTAPVPYEKKILKIGGRAPPKKKK